MTNTNFSVYPAAGQLVNVLHKSDGNGKLIKAGRDTRQIKAVHIIESGYPTVTDSSGDVWSVKPAKVGEWDTVNPQ